MAPTAAIAAMAGNAFPPAVANVESAAAGAYAAAVAAPSDAATIADFFANA